MAVLIGHGGTQDGRSYPIHGNLVIGRGVDADVQVLEKEVSRQHACVFQRDDGAIVLMDLASQNGTFVDGQQISKVELKLGDRFRIGESIFSLGDSVDGETAESFDDDFKIQSGPALDETRGVFSNPLAQPLCEHPLHTKALENRWKFCPACGSETLL